MHFVTVTLWHLISVGSNFGIFMGFFLIDKKLPQRKVLAFFSAKIYSTLEFYTKIAKNCFLYKLDDKLPLVFQIVHCTT